MSNKYSIIVDYSEEGIVIEADSYEVNDNLCLTLYNQEPWTEEFKVQMLKHAMNGFPLRDPPKTRVATFKYWHSVIKETDDIV